MKVTIRIVCSCFVLCLPGIVAGAPAAVCERYAKDAVTAQQINQRDRCELIGDPWSLNERNHFNWCLGVDQQALDRENGNRRAELAKCTRCTDYAHTAVDAQKINKAKGCGLTGDLWSEHERNHYRWCTRVAQRDAGWHERRRDELLKACQR